MNSNASKYIDITTNLFMLYNKNEEGLTELFDNINELINNFNKQPDISVDNTTEEVNEETSKEVKEKKTKKEKKEKKEKKTSKDKQEKPKKEKKIKN